VVDSPIMNVMSGIEGFILSYILNPQNLGTVVIVGILGIFLYKLIKNDLDKVSGNIKTVGNRVIDIEGCVTEIQSCLKIKYPRLALQRTIPMYSQSASPIVLKDDFKIFITAPGMDKQIAEKKNELLEWLKGKNSETGLDAQDYIADLVSSDEIERFLDLSEYKNNLYQKGKTSEAASGILAVYLFQVLIPELHLPEKKPDNKDEGYHKK